VNQPIYFNEFDSYPADWLRNLFPRATVDARSIVDLQPSDVSGYARAHFFAGIGGWEYALSLAGWPQDRDVWTGSCPCQPFSAAGKGKGEADERHLWPEFRRLIAECRPPVVFGEQVASRLGREWLAGVRADLEALGYAVGAADLCAAGVGAPHLRQRLYWVAHTLGPGLQGHLDPPDTSTRGITGGLSLSRDGGAIRGLAHTERDPGGPGWVAVEPGEGAGAAGAGAHAESGRCRDLGGLGDPCGPGLPERVGHGRIQRGSGQADAREASVMGGHTSWGDTWLQCLDGKARRVEPGIFPLAHGVPGRVGRLRAYGNAIVPHVAARFIRAYLETQP
jgi:DNA (cytosine-5)-methyltransferase 1